MATSAKDKLPQFGSSATTDSRVIDNTSELKTTGFQPKTTIKSAAMNSYIKMMVNALRGLADSLTADGANQDELNALSTDADWEAFIKGGLSSIIANTRVKTADSLSTNAGSTSLPVWFNEGKPTTIFPTSLVTSWSAASLSDPISVGASKSGVFQLPADYWTDSLQFYVNVFSSPSYDGSSESTDEMVITTPTMPIGRYDNGNIICYGIGNYGILSIRKIGQTSITCQLQLQLLQSVYSASTSDSSNKARVIPTWRSFPSAAYDSDLVTEVKIRRIR